MTPAERESIAAELRRRRATLLGQVAGAEADLAAMAAEAESELEERAQEERLARLVARLDDREREEVEAIQLALERLLEGTYERCEACGGPIGMARLRALPTVRRCIACAEAAAPEPGEGERLPAGRPAPAVAEWALLSDREREEALRELVRQDGRVDMEELRIVCRHDVAYLDGAVPSAAERDIVRRLVTDVAGVVEVVDRLRIDELAWERGDRMRREPKSRPAGFEPAATEDVVESEELGIDFEPPVRPVPDES